MKKLVAPLSVALVLTSCSSVEVADSMPNPDQRVVENRLNIMTDFDASHCKGEGFKVYQEREKYYVFTCNNGSVFKIPK